MANILAVDDDIAILNMIGNVLTKDAHTVTKLDDPTKIENDKLGNYDLILLDVMMPGIDGFELCTKIRNQVDCPILFITAKTDETSLVNGLALGADDYICKPFGVMELRARIGAHLRREKREHVARLSLGRICFMLEARQMMLDEKQITLTKAEYDICEFLAKNRGQIFSKEQILEKVLGYDSDSSDSTIITHVKNIRTKLSGYDYMPIKTVWGIGYKWEE
ncbi:MULTISPECIES: response regulator transcription factor [unclassified Butyrivibrio]|uniref:response regulator transcription factor n=1 Tax=unclassified Butyrivibrio TaxID=2639466 RepID=UPI0004173451|nr:MULTISPECIES: response regulator transcription factor [unclassified Butyrivibrio]